MADNYSQDVEKSSDESDLQDDKKILKEAQDFIALVQDAESENRKLALEDLEFAAGKQWPASVELDRQRKGRPCLTINRLPQFIQQVTNDQRQNRPSIKVHPVDDQADVKTAKKIQGLTRHIEYNSNADAAYDTAFEYAAKMGWGFWRVLTGYCDPMSFDQEILIKRIRNPFSVFFDPYAQEPDGSDAKRAAIIEDYSPDAYRAEFPNSKLAQKGEWEITGAHAPGWMPEGSARVAEYFYTAFKEVELVQLSNGQTIEKSKLPEYAASLVNEQGALVSVSIVKERVTQVPVVKWCKLNAVEILEKTEWPGKYIPIVPVYGTDQFIDGKRVLKGIIRDAKDSQRMYNYWASAETEAIALAPRAPFIGASGQFEGHESKWETANRENHAYLEYNAKSANGELIGPPQRSSIEPAVQAITQARMMASEDLKSTTGIYDAALGAKSNETSGVAIQRRNMQAQTSNYHYVDNLTRSLRHTGRILVDLIPKIYDTARTARIIGEDGEQQVIRVNEPFVENGEEVLYQLDAGKYDVTVDVGPSFASKRQEAVAAMLEVTKAYPALMNVAGDLFVKSQDWPGAEEIAERIKKTLPPNLIEDTSKQNQQLPPQAQAQMQQMNQMIEQLTEKLHEAQDQLDHKRVELESKERIEFAKIQADLEIAMAKLGSQESLALLQHQIAEIEGRLKLLSFNIPMPSESGGAQDMTPMPTDGASSADVGGAGQYPTGGESPGSPMEGQPHDNPGPF